MGWLPRVLPGYFYIGEDEYYLFADKKVLSGVASGGTLVLPSMTFLGGPVGPVIVTDLDDYTVAAATGVPFGKTYEYPSGDGEDVRTPDKYRRRYSLSGKMDPEEYAFTLADHEFFLDWGESVDGTFTPTLYVSPANASIIIELEDPANTTPFYQVPDINLNPLDSPVVARKFLVVTDENTTAGSIHVFASTSITPQAATQIYALVETASHMPVQGVTVTFSTSATGNGKGVLSSTTGVTGWDGKATTTWTPSSPTVNYPKIGITITATFGALSGSVVLHHGKLF